MRTLPEHQRPDGKDQHLLEEPDQRPDGPERPVSHRRLRRLDRPPGMVAPLHGDPLANALARAPHGPDVVGVVGEWATVDGQELIAHLRPLARPDIFVRYGLLQLGAKDTAHPDVTHPGHLSQDGHRIQDHHHRAADQERVVPEHALRAVPGETVAACEGRSGMGRAGRRVMRPSHQSQGVDRTRKSGRSGARRGPPEAGLPRSPNPL